MARTQVQAELIATNAISGTIIADGAITSTHLAANSVDTAELVTGSIDTIHIAANQVTSAKIASNSILTRHIQDDQITGDQLTNNITIAGTLTSTGTITVGDGHTIGNDGDDNLVITGSASENIIIDSADDIVLDADGGDFIFKDGGTEQVRLKAGKLGIGTDDPDALIEIVSSDPRIRLRDDTAGGAADGGGILEFVGYHAGSSDGKREWARITGLKENATGGNVDGYLKFYTNSGSLTERMRITSDGNVGIGAAPTLGALHVTSATNDIVTFENTSTGTTGAQLALYHNSSSPADGDRIGALNFQGEDDAGNHTTYAGIRGYSADVSNGSEDGTLTFSTTSGGTFTEAMRIDSSGNVGINCTNPQVKFAVQNTDGESGIEFSLGASLNYLQSYDRNASDYIALKIDGEDLRFGTNDGTERMRIDSTGKVGIGTTSPLSHLTFESDHWNTGTETGPSIRWNNGITTADSVIQSFEDSNVAPFVIGMNSYINSGGTYAPFNSSYPSSYIYQQASGILSMGTAASGTPATRFHIAANGNVGIGNTNPQHPFIVDLQSGEVAMFGSNGMNNSGAYAGIGIGQVLANNTTYQKIKIVAEGRDNGHYKQNFHVLVDIAADGNSAVLADSKFRIDGDDGSVTVGATTVTNNYVLNVKTSHGLGQCGSHNSTYFHHQTDRTYFYWDKACYASGGFHTYSDERLKKDITPVTGALDSVAKMNGVTFKWIDPEGRGGNSTGKQFGVTAQNMLTIDSELPSLDKDPLSNIKEGVNESDEWYTMNYDRLSPFFIEAIKELKTRLEAAEAEIKTLKG